MRTVRSAAWSRNRPRRRLAWLIVLILLVLIALAARIDAAPGTDPVDLAVRYANVLTGVDADAERAAAVGDPDDEDDDEDHDDATAETAGGDVEDSDDPKADRDDDAAGDVDPDLGGVTGKLGDALDAAVGDPAGNADPAIARALGTVGDVLDAELDPGDLPAGAGALAAPAGAAEAYEQRMRPRRPRLWGRLDVGVAWRRRWSEPMHAPSNRYDELWLVATWRR